ncbi:MAG: hypothetical protein AAF399_29480, partial [Bacteroidota bacterium]
SGVFLLTWSPVSAQYVQNPFWTLPPVPILIPPPPLPIPPANPPITVKNGVPMNATQVVYPPFTEPTPFGTYPRFSIRATAANGLYDECGDPVIYVMNDHVFGVDLFGNFGLAGNGYLFLKDRFLKWNDPNDDFDLDNPTPNLTENFEAPLFEVPGQSGQYYLVYNNNNNFGTEVFFATYHVSSQSVSQPLQGSPPDYSTVTQQVRYAVSPVLNGGGRNVYVVTQDNEVSYIPISGTGVIQNSVKLQSGGAIVDFLSAELELSHDGNTLAWASNSGATAVIHFFDLPTSTHTTFEMAPGAFRTITGLEFLADGRLAITATWNGVFFVYDGISIFNTSLTGLNFISSSKPYGNSMLELGVDGRYLLYANKGDYILCIHTLFNAPTAAYSIDLTADPSSGLASGFVSTFVSGALPDQIDGEFYVYPLNCPSDGDPPPLRMAEEIPDSPVPPDFTFEPIIRSFPTHR